MRWGICMPIALPLTTCSKSHARTGPLSPSSRDEGDSVIGGKSIASKFVCMTRWKSFRLAAPCAGAYFQESSPRLW